jgi:hypothetical protein
VDEGWALVPIALYFAGIGLWLWTELIGIRSRTDRWPAFTDLVRALPLPLKVAVSAGIAALGVWAGGHFLEFWP